MWGRKFAALSLYPFNAIIQWPLGKGVWGIGVGQGLESETRVLSTDQSQMVSAVLAVTLGADLFVNT